MHVADPDPVTEDLSHAFLGNAHAVVFNFNEQSRLVGGCANGNFAAAKPGGQAMLEAIFDDGLQEHAGDKGIERVVLDLFMNLQRLSRPNRATSMSR